MQLKTFGTWASFFTSVGAGAFIQSPDYQFLALPIAVFSGALFLILASMFLFTNRIHIARASALIEPFHIVAIGLVIAAAGVIWQWLRLTTPDPQIAALKSQIAILQSDLSRARSVSEKPSQPVAPIDAKPKTRLPDPIFKYDRTKIKRYDDVSRFTLDKDQRLWLDTIYQSFLNNTQQPAYVLRRRLVGQVSADFNEKAVDRHLAFENRITLLGVWNLDQNTDWLWKVDLVIRYIKQIIRDDPNTNWLVANELAEKLNLTIEDFSRCFELAGSISLNWATGGAGSSSTGTPPNHVIQFTVGSEQIFKGYEAYEGIEKALNDFAKGPPP